jgi:alpha-beta hydrolase superfamily lysophospholipase
VVICNPLGYEAVCAHRGLRHFAEAAAAAGYPALRFDYDGTGDSAGDELDPERWPAWCASTRDAVDEIKRSAGVTAVCLVGVRLGAVLATREAARDDVAGLALVAPIASGRLWLREMRAVHASMGRPDPPSQFALPSDAHEGIGLLFDSATRDAVSAIDMTSDVARLPPEVLLIDRSDRPQSTALVMRLRGQGADVTHTVLPGFVEMTLDPHFAVPPTAMIASFVGWLTERFPAVRKPPVAAVEFAADPPAVLVAPSVEERAHFLDRSRRVFGIVSRPADSRPTRAVVLLNSGATPHVGTGRLSVKLARRLAARGWLALRYDLSGIGDSRSHSGTAENEVYSSQALADLETALRFIRARYDLAHVEALGLCSGGYHAFKGATAGLPLDGLVVINPLTFFWQPGMSLAYPPYRMAQTAAQYRRSVLQPSKWRKLLGGQVNIDLVGRVIRYGLADRVRIALREVARALRIPLPRDLAREIEEIAKRGIALRFVFSEGDPGEALLRSGTGSRLGWLARKGRLRIDTLTSCDHSLSCAWMHEALWRLLTEYYNW